MSFLKGLFGNAVAEAAEQKSFYDFTANSIDGEEISMSCYRGNVVVIVNVASKRYHSQGLQILAFPCNQFGGQEPLSNPEIKTFATTNYGAEFQIFEKIKVNGSDAHPLYVYLKEALGGSLLDAIKWNFTKFVVDHNGVPVRRFGPKEEVDSMIPLLEVLLEKRNRELGVRGEEERPKSKEGEVPGDKV